MEPGSRRVALVVAYDGADYAGWQVQPDRPTVEGEIEAALTRLLGRPGGIVGAGRTDAGVHALGQVAHADIPLRLSDREVRGALNAGLPSAIRIRAAKTVPDGFHARHGAVRKTYVYQLHGSRSSGSVGALQRSLPPHRRRTFFAVRADLDLAAMRAAASQLVGRHDFTALSKVMPVGRSTVKQVEAVRVVRIAQGLRLVVSGEGFLYGMVRLLAGLLVETGAGRRTSAEVQALLASRARSSGPAALPARGLFLWRVDYPDALGLRMRSWEQADAAADC